MRRRTFMQGVGATVAAAGLARPALAQGAANRLVYVPPAGLAILDPHFTTVNHTQFYGHCVYDMLYSVDSTFRAMPQMAEGHRVSDDMLTWDIVLREGLRFHDGEPVRPQDCIASINRWSQRDAFGATLLEYIEEMTAADDRTIRFQLKRPFGILPDALAHPTASGCYIMPERVAMTPITEQVTEAIGSGPLRFNMGEFVPGQHAVFERNADYVSRQEPSDGLAGGRQINFDVIEWRTLADQSTAIAALQAGEVDWVDSIHLDLVPVVQNDPNLIVQASDTGYRNWIRFNNGIGTFTNPELRRAVASAIDQTVFSAALMSDQQPCYAMFSCEVPGMKQPGESVMAGEKDFEAIAARVKEAGYGGEKIVILNGADIPTEFPMGPLLVETLTRIGFNVELQSVDSATKVSRRASQAPVEEGGWSIFTFLTTTPNAVNPVVNVTTRGRGLKGYPGNYDDPTLEGHIHEWIGAVDEAERAQKMDLVHDRLWEMTPNVPLAGYANYTAMRNDLTGYIPNTVAIPWNLRRG